MSKSSEQAIREFEEKHKHLSWTFERDANGKRYVQRHENLDVIHTDLTALIKEHFVPKEDVDAEVERRIEERQLTDEEIINCALTYVNHKSLKPANRGLIKDAIIIGMTAYRSRLTNNSQKTEGGKQ